jgi:hypothetical protein
MIKISKLCLAILGFSLMPACNGADNEGNLQLKLPKDLREVSGLAAIQNDQLLAVADEQALVFKIDMTAGTISRYLTFGKPIAKGDFEGVAILNDAVYLVTSQGALWRQVTDGSTGQYQIISTDAGERCEVEGLAAWHEKDSLLLLCKTVYRKNQKDTLVVLRWSEKAPEAPTEPLIDRTYADMGIEKLHPSGLTFSADRQHLFIVAARQKAFLEVTLDGEVIRYGKLPKGAGHRQTEGVAITHNNKLYLADEGGKGKGMLTEYAHSF